MYGLIGKITATPGKRDVLARILLDSTGDMAGCISYVVAEDTVDQDSLWITEVWTSEDAHQASLRLVAVKEAIAKARPVIASFSDRHVTRPLGGYGLTRPE